MRPGLVSLALLVVLPSGQAHAASERWPVEKIVAAALERAPEAKALLKDVERADALARQAGRWENPELAASYGPMTQAGERGKNIDLAVRQSVPLFGQKALARELGERERDALGAKGEQARLALRVDITSLAYRLAATVEESKHVAHRRESVQAVLKFLESRPQASPAQLVEKSLLLARVREIEEDLLEIGASRAKLWSALDVFLAHGAEIEPEVDWKDLPAPPDRDALWSRARTANPELRWREQKLAASGVAAAQAARRIFPEIRIGAAYNEQTAEFPQRIYTGILELTLPFLDAGGAARDAAAAQKEADELRLEQERRELQARFDEAWATLTQSRKRVELYPAALIGESEERMRVGEQGWRKGLVQTPAFLELEHEMHLQAVKFYAARVDYVVSIGKLTMLAGEAGPGALK